MLISDDAVTYFSYLDPFDSHPIDDRYAMRLRIGRFAALGEISLQHLADAFGARGCRCSARGNASTKRERRGF